MRILIFWFFTLLVPIAVVAEEQPNTPRHPNVLVLIDTSGSLGTDPQLLPHIRNSVQRAAVVLKQYSSVYIAFGSDGLRPLQVWRFVDTEQMIARIRPKGASNLGQMLQEASERRAVSCAGIVFLVHGEPHDFALFHRSVHELSATRSVTILLIDETGLNWYRHVAHNTNYRVELLSAESLTRAIERSLPSSGCLF